MSYEKPVRTFGMEELAARQRSIKPTGGVLFARNVDGEEKIKARQMVLELVRSVRIPCGWVRCLTMPGLAWRFERLLLGEAQPGWTRHTYPKYYHFTAIENDRAIFFASVPQMPGLHTPQSSLRRIVKYKHFAEMAVKTNYASLFFADIDDFMAMDWDKGPGFSGGWHVAWIDYTGPLSVERLAIIRNFYDRFVDNTLIVTALRARFETATSRAIQKAGGYSEWMQANLPGEVLHYLEYFDTSPMAQFAVKKP